MCKRAAAVTVALLVIVASVLHWRGYFAPRPLFHEWQTWERPTWYLITPVKDGRGNWIFFDPKLNLAALVMSDLPEDRFNPLPRTDSTGARFWPETDYEVPSSSLKETVCSWLSQESLLPSTNWPRGRLRDGRSNSTRFMSLAILHTQICFLSCLRNEESGPGNDSGQACARTY